MATIEAKIASAAQLDFFAALWAERTDEPFDRTKFEKRTSRDLSALIRRAMQRPALPATDEQGDEIHQLAQQLGVQIVVAADRAGANRQLRDLRTKINRAEWNGALAEADAELDALLGGSTTSDDDGVPF